MQKRGWRMIAMMAFTALTMFAADASGKWSGEVEGRNGQKRTQTFNLKADGGKLTGTMVGPGGREVNIEDGKVSGDDISFAVTLEMGGNTRKIPYKGKVAGDEIQFKSGEGERAREFTAKRATN